jgi:hypothetical protein
VFAWLLLKPPGMLLDIVVDLGPGRLPLIDVVEPFGIREIVGLARVATFIE